VPPPPSPIVIVDADAGCCSAAFDEGLQKLFFKEESLVCPLILSRFLIW
jgi:hypothetical protein